MHARLLAWAGLSLLERQTGKALRPCSSCKLRHAISFFELRRRKQSSLASLTAVNAHPIVPPPFRQLYKTLEAVKRHAAAFTSLGRLSLALRSLESTSPVIRIALIDLDGKAIARKLARLLLVDPLTPEPPWEKQLQDSGTHDNRSLLIRYGEDTEPAPHHSLVDTMRIPSRLLRERNLEILLSSINAGLDSPTEALEYQTLKRSALVPTVETARSFSGAMTFITYPVHRAIVLAENVNGSLILGRYATPQKMASKQAKNIFVAGVDYSVPLQNLEPHSTKEDSPLLLVNTKDAQIAVDSYRDTGAQTTVFEERWLASGLPVLNQWLQGSLSSSELQAPIYYLIWDTLQEALSAIHEAEHFQSESALKADPTTPSTRSLDTALAQWTTQAHSELQEGLEHAFSGRSWVKLRWWKLFWRVDDVGMLLSELLERKWLCEAEMRLMYLAGRCREAGIMRWEDLPTATPPNAASSSKTSHEVQSGTEVDPLISEAWPSIIPTMRASLLKNSVPPLEVLAQKLLLQTVSGFASSIAISALIYTTFQSVTGFEALAFAAFGFIWSIWRLQGRWEDARSLWQTQIQEAGRATLKDTESGIQAALRKGSQETSREIEDAKMWMKSREAVNEALAALEKLGPEHREARIA